MKSGVWWNVIQLHVITVCVTFLYNTQKVVLHYYTYKNCCFSCKLVLHFVGPCAGDVVYLHSLKT